MNPNKTNAQNDANLSDEPVSLADSLVDDGQPPKESFFKTKGFYAIIGVVSVLFIALIAILLMSGGEEARPQQQSIEQSAPEDMRLAQEEQRNRAAEATPSLDPEIAALPSDDFVFSSTPVLALGEQSIRNIFEEMPLFINDGARITAPDGKFMVANDPYILNSLNETANMVSGYVQEQRLIEERVDESGNSSWFIRSGEGFSDENYVPIQTAKDATILRDQMRQYALTKMQEKMAVAPWQTPQAQESNGPQIVINPALTQEERERLLTMIETQRANNLELVRENKEVREDMIDLKKKIASLVQRLEDSPSVNARLRATMIPESTGWKVTAVVGDRVYLINEAKETVTLSQGDRIPSSNLIVSHTDESTGIVLVTPAN